MCVCVWARMCVLQIYKIIIAFAIFAMSFIKFIEMTEEGTLSKPNKGQRGPIPSVRASLTAACECCVLYLTLCLMLIAIPELQLCRGFGVSVPQWSNATVMLSFFVFDDYIAMIILDFFKFLFLFIILLHITMHI